MPTRANHPRGVAAILVGLAACGSPAAPAATSSGSGSGSPAANQAPRPSAAPGPPGRLDAHSPVKATDLAATLTITNHGTAPLLLPRANLEIPMFAMEVDDASGARVPTESPPVPTPSDVDEVTIAPGAVLVHTYSLDFFSPPLSQAITR